MAKILCLIDSFKGTLSSRELGEITQRILNNKGHKVDFFPISDGGEGFLEAIHAFTHTKRIEIPVLNPLGKEIHARYAFDDVLGCAYIEMAQISGLNLLDKQIRNPKLATTYGLGQCIKEAVKHGAKKIIIGIGGSATNDGGAGMLEALGVRFFDHKQQEIKQIKPNDFMRIKSIDKQLFEETYKRLEVIVLSDVSNPLLGKQGATYIYGPQKGVSHEDVVTLEQGLNQYAKILSHAFNNDYIHANGAGAAGGVGFAFYTAFKSTFKSGINQLLTWLDFEKLSQKYDYIITGEGSIDEQSLQGKVIFGILNRSKASKVILVAGQCHLDDHMLKAYHIDHVYSVVGDGIATVEASIINPKQYFSELIEKIELK